jgi:predicted transcriptional regulator
MTEEDFDRLLQFFKALADETRLRIVGLLANRHRNVEELAAALDVKPPTVSHHLNKLRELGLVVMRPEGNVHIYALNIEGLMSMSRTMLTPDRVARMVEDDAGEAWERKVLRDFFDGERLKEIPASRKKRLVILRWLVSQFEWEREYAETEVNEIISRYHPDYATLRREFIGNGLMQRKNGIYWRIESS